MTARDMVAYLFGDAAAIRNVARSRSALPVGVGLVLLTAVARNSDQDWIGENPWMWAFGPLAFSLVSGTWLFAVVYCWLARRVETEGGDPRGGWKDWACFMGLFWMTAPVAWLYAIPVERFLDAVPAAYANLALMAIVSVWRVTLFARVIHVLLLPGHARLAVAWVLLPVSVEVFAVTFLGSLGDAIMRGMGGLRHSPEATIVARAMGSTAMASLVVGVLSLLAVLLLRPRGGVGRLSAREPGALPWRMLAGCTAFWVGAGAINQPYVFRSSAVERMTKAGNYREALDFMILHGPGGFAPSRSLPPRPYLHRSFEELSGFLSASRATDAAWLRAHSYRRLDEWVESQVPAWRRREEPGNTWEPRVWLMPWGSKDAIGKALRPMFDWLEADPSGEGLAWIRRHRAYWKYVIENGDLDHDEAGEGVRKVLARAGVESVEPAPVGKPEPVAKP